MKKPFIKDNNGDDDKWRMLKVVTIIRISRPGIRPGFWFWFRFWFRRNDALDAPALRSPAISPARHAHLR